MRCHDETMTTVVRTLRNSIRTVGKLRDKTCQLMDIIPIRFGAFFGQSDEFWHGIQVECDFRRLAGDRKKLTAGIRPATTLSEAL